MSLEAYHLASEGHLEGNRDHWEQTRLVAYHCIAPHLKKNTSITSFMSFEWDNKKDTDIITKEEKDYHKEQIKKQFPDLK